MFAYIASLPQPQRGVAARVDALAAETVPDLQRALKWGMAWPEPPVTPVGMGESTRGVELGSVDDLDERQVASWMKQAAAIPFLGGKKR